MATVGTMRFTRTTVHPPWKRGNALHKVVSLMIGTRELVVVVIGICFLLIIAALCLFWPDAVREYSLRSSDNPLARRFNPFLGWMNKSQYIWSLRLTGLLALGAIVLLTVGVIRSGR